MPPISDEVIMDLVKRVDDLEKDMRVLRGQQIYANTDRTVSLLHFNGVDGSTTFIDQRGKIWSVAGNAQLDTAQYKFGGSSLLLDGIGDYISTPDSSDFAFGTGDFTIDFWIRFNTLPSIGTQMAVFSQSADANNFQKIAFVNNAGIYSWNYDVVVGGSSIVSINKITTISTSTWYHTALVRSGTNWYFFKDGTQIGTTVTDSDAINDFSASAVIGFNGLASYYMDGWIDEFRISKGISRWTANFTPPDNEYI